MKLISSDGLKEFRISHKQVDSWSKHLTFIPDCHNHKPQFIAQFISSKILEKVATTRSKNGFEGQHIGMGRGKTRPDIWPDPSNFLEDPSQPVVILS